MATGTTNREFSETDTIFKKACELADVKPTQRQASKWRRGYGSAFKFRAEASKIIPIQLKT